ncbi:hypothetical protein DPEC_G00367570 [Dallia pectoralis]|nr:hypothetical protein DPEC_G00367570 [Dallia pectoralis]
MGACQRRGLDYLNRKPGPEAERKAEHTNTCWFFQQPGIGEKQLAWTPRWNSSTHEYEATSSHTGPVKGFPLRPGLIVSTGQLMCVEGSVLYATVLAAGVESSHTFVSITVCDFGLLPGIWYWFLVLCAQEQIVWGYGGPDS